MSPRDGRGSFDRQRNNVRRSGGTRISVGDFFIFRLWLLCICILLTNNIELVSSFLVGSRTTPTTSRNNNHRMNPSHWSRRSLRHIFHRTRNGYCCVFTHSMTSTTATKMMLGSSVFPRTTSGSTCWTSLLSSSLLKASSTNTESNTNTNTNTNTDISPNTNSPSELKALMEEAREATLRQRATLPVRLATASLVRQILDDLERESSEPDFWGDTNADRRQAVHDDLSRYNSLHDLLSSWERGIDDLDAAADILEEENDPMIAEECATVAQFLLESTRSYEESLLTRQGPYDDRPARIVVQAGAGGTEACDWVDMLVRMYERQARRRGFTIRTENAVPGDVVGHKSVELLVDKSGSAGGNADAPYGWFRHEKGAHRLVRLSPFNAGNKRQTTFAGVDVFPVMEETDASLGKIDIPDADLEVSFMKSGGKGGQNVNKVETGVRMVHLPTGIAVKCTQERSQSRNRDIALARIKAKLLVAAHELRVQEINAIRGDAVEAAWGAQIRNYVLQPYKMVKDLHGSGWETSDVQNVLDGGTALEDCILSILRYNARQRDEEEAEGRNK